MTFLALGTTWLFRPQQECDGVVETEEVHSDARGCTVQSVCMDRTSDQRILK